MMKLKESMSKTDFVFLAPSAAPQNVQGSSSSFDSIRVTWTPPAFSAQNGDINSYILSYQVVGQDDTKKSKTMNGASRKSDLTELDANKVYKITVRATTSAGEGPSSNAITVRTAEAGK